MHARRALALLSLSAAAATLAVACMRAAPAETTPSLPGCGKDTDCKGARICASGRCVDPPDGSAGTRGAIGSASSDGGGPLLDGGALPGDGGVMRTDAGASTIGDGGLGFVPAPPPSGPSVMFHGGPRHTGRSPYRAPARTPREISRLETRGTVFSSPALADDGSLYFGSHDKSIYGAGPAPVGEADGGASGPGATRFATRWSRATGDLVWCSPALGADKTVYVGSDDDKLYALAESDGTPRWTFTAGPCHARTPTSPEGARCDVDGVTVGPDGGIYLVADGVYALRPDGTLRWRFALPIHCAGAPAIAVDGTVYAGCQDGALYAIGPDGRKRWELRTGDDIDSPPAIAEDGTVYVGSDDGKLYAIAPAAMSATVKWALQTGGAIRGGPALAPSGNILVGAQDGALYSVRPTGQVAWTFRAADRFVSSPLVDADGVILIGSEDDRLYAVEPDGRLRWSVLLGGDVDSTPVLGPDGTIYVGADDKALHILR